MRYSWQLGIIGLEPTVTYFADAYIGSSVSMIKHTETDWRIYAYNQIGVSEYMRQWTMPPLIQIIACRLFGAKPLSKPMLTNFQMDPNESSSQFKHFRLRRCVWKCRLQNGGLLILASMN